MSTSKFLLTSVLIYLLVFRLVHSDNQERNKNEAGGSFVPKEGCPVACAARCSLASRQNLCKRACGTCCVRCNCVPPGTSGNQQVCPCYYSMTTHGGRRKCP